MAVRKVAHPSIDDRKAKGLEGPGTGRRCRAIRGGARQRTARIRSRHPLYSGRRQALGWQLELRATRC